MEISIPGGVQRDGAPWHSRRPWSLWDMIRFEASNFLNFQREFGRLVAHLSEGRPDRVRETETRRRDAKTLKSFSKHFLQIGLVISDQQLDRMVKRCRNQVRLTNKEMAEMCNELLNRVTDECRLMHFFCLNDSEKNLFAAECPHFGDAVAAKFPSVSEDISEAAKCIALGRYTAAIFHLMRVMETATQKLGDLLGVALVGEKNWQNILDETNKAIKKLDHKDSRTKALAEVSAHLYGVKIAWRNEVMHPKQTYTSDEAEAVFSHTKIFMQQLATVI